MMVTIITPTYNHEKYIDECIQSVVQQTYKNWEQIIVDDGSLDNTACLVKKYKDERIKLIEKENEGIENLSKSYNLALEKARGEIIAILEGDDFWPDYKLEKQLEAFKKENIILSWGRGALVNENSKVIGYTRKPPSKKEFLSNSPIGAAVVGLIYGNYLDPSSSVMIRKKALKKIGGFIQPEGAVYLDYPTWLELSLVGEFSFVDKILGYYRQHSQQVSQRMRPAMTKSWDICQEEFFKKLPEEINHKYRIMDRHVLPWKIWREVLKHLDKKEWQEARGKIVFVIKNIRSWEIKIKGSFAFIGTFLKTDWAFLRKPKKNFFNYVRTIMQKKR